ncbi:MAG: hypothetical protein Q8K30_00675 [Candidatus Gracilibacteria bacterium]|nr:hypothetical protein [Candidatus Gracilibacteria bacterium]
MSIYNKNNKFVSYIIILFSLFILVLFTSDKIKEIYENKDLKETYTLSLNDKKAKLTELNTLKNSLVNSKADLDKYNVIIKEDEIIDYIYSTIESKNDRNGTSSINSLNISEPIKTELGFNETLITINIRVANEAKLKEILDVFLGKKSKYLFYISSFSFPYGETQEKFSVTIPLKILHK